MLLTTCSLGVAELRSSNSTARHHSQRQIKKAKPLFTEQGIIAKNREFNRELCVFCALKADQTAVIPIRRWGVSGSS